MKLTSIISFALFVATHASAQTELMPKCELPTVDGNPPCWHSLDSHENCYVWNGSPKTDEIITWSGQCHAGIADGEGKLTRRSADGEENEIGSFTDGKPHGEWKIHWANGDISSGYMVKGKMHGQWKMRFADGTVLIGSYVDGAWNGRWEIRTADGDEHIGPYVNGKRHGRWKTKMANGVVWIGPYVTDKRHGKWERGGRMELWQLVFMWTTKSMDIGKFGMLSGGEQDV